MYVGRGLLSRQEDDFMGTRACEKGVLTQSSLHLVYKEERYLV